MQIIVLRFCTYFFQIYFLFNKGTLAQLVSQKLVQRWTMCFLLVYFKLNILRDIRTKNFVDFFQQSGLRLNSNLLTRFCIIFIFLIKIFKRFVLLYFFSGLVGSYYVVRKA